MDEFDNTNSPLQNVDSNDSSGNDKNIRTKVASKITKD